MENKKLIVIQGPTASGKTALSIQLAHHFNCSILSADSRQFYKEMSIGTAKPTKEEQDGIPHYFIDSHSIEEPVSAAQFEKEALKTLENQFQKNDFCILVGGSGLFIDALCDGLDPLPSDADVQKKWQTYLKDNGLENLQNVLIQKDPEFAQKVDLKNPHRVLRALEIITITGKTIAEVRSNSKKFRPFAIHRFVIDLPREGLYDRINLRVDQMIIAGLENEVRNLMPYKNLQSLNTVGYQEFFDFFDGKIDFETAVSSIQQNSRRYAKRQLTWFRRNPDNIWLKGKSTNDLFTEIIQHLNIK